MPQFWSLQEQDAYLRVVDVSTLDLDDVERIEVLHGPAPVMYGATSFVGVIQVVRKAPGGQGSPASPRAAAATGAAAGLFRRASPAGWVFDSSLVADFQRQGFRDERTSFKKGHVLSRNQRVSGQGVFRFDFDAVFLRQQPASPSPRTGPALAP